MVVPQPLFQNVITLLEEKLAALRATPVKDLNEVVQSRIKATEAAIKELQAIN